MTTTSAHQTTRNLIIGTAGHIDHGKTALVKALTGVDADRFPEEKQRGITIDIGFAELDLDGFRIGFVDVPGHERFVKNMLAGASGIDAVMLIVAADEGVMPQTREHFDICRLLGIKAGIVVITKTDLVDDELLELVTLDVHDLIDGSFLENAPIVAVSSKTGAGIDELRANIIAVATTVSSRDSEKVARLPIDRSFAVKGFGTVVTGTLVAGEFREGQEAELLPARRSVRIRGIQTHGQSVASAAAGQRTAINLGGVDHAEVERGMVLAESGVLRPTQAIDCLVEVLKDAARPLRTRQRIRFHIGTVEALARVQVLNEIGEIAPGDTDLVQVRPETPIVCVPDERFILRFYSPQITIAGGTVIDNGAVRHRRSELPLVRERLGAMTDPARRVRVLLDIAGNSGLTFPELQSRTAWKPKMLEGELNAAVEKRSAIFADPAYVARTPFDSLRDATLETIADFHRREPLSKGIQRETLRDKIFARLAPEIFRAVLASLESEKKIVSDKDTVRIAGHNLELSGAEAGVRDRLVKLYETAGLEVPKLDEALGQAVAGSNIDGAQARKIFQLIVSAGEVLKVTDEFYFSRRAIDGLSQKLKQFVDQRSDRLIDVAEFKDLAGISRKYAIPLLEFFDREKVTRRAGDKRLVI